MVSAKEIYESAKQGELQLQEIIEKYKDINEIKDNGWTALHWAAREENLEAAILLMKLKANVKQNE